VLLQLWLRLRRAVIYVGLGTLVQLSQPQLTTLVDAFKRLRPNPHILWKLPDSQRALLPAGEILPSNVRIEHWIPSQLSVLAHPNMRVFVTHGGGNGFHEGIYFGKPLLVMPFGWIASTLQRVQSIAALAWRWIIHLRLLRMRRSKSFAVCSKKAAFVNALNIGASSCEKLESGTRCGSCFEGQR
jgi:UDP-glucoronosyl and UDP-glucosyl transferase